MTNYQKSTKFPVMILIGMTALVRQEAEKRFAGAFRAWHGEMSAGAWTGWGELLKHYPQVKRTGGNEAHFPLGADGSGIRAAVRFRPGLMRLLRVASHPPAPSRSGEPRNLLSHPATEHEHQPTTL